MIVLGLLGGVASGKSFVAREFEKLGAAILDGDKAGHEVLKQAEVIEELTRRWGKQILDASGEIDRRAVAKIVFAPPPQGPHELEFLERVTHPRIGTLLQEKLKKEQDKKTPVAILDAALLLKAGWDKYCDKILFVDVPRELRLQRAASRGWDTNELARREAAQGSLEEKLSRADVVIDNSGDPEQTRRQVKRVWRQLTNST